MSIFLVGRRRGWSFWRVIFSAGSIYFFLLLFLFPRISLADIVPLSTGLVGYWTLDGKDTNWNTNKTNDLSGNNNTGTLTNMSTSTGQTIGKVGQGLYFNGAASNAGNVTIPSSSSLQFSGAVPITISVWVKPVQNTGYATFLIKGRESNDSAANYALRQDVSGKRLEFYFNDVGSNTWHIWASTSNVFTQTNVWYHLVVTYTFGTANSISVYVNGTSISGAWGSSQGSVTADVDTQALTLGWKTNTGSSNEQFTGVLDEVRIYNRMLTSAEVNQLYRLSQSKQGVSMPKTTTGLGSGLVGYWSMDGKYFSGNSITNQGSLGGTGTVSGSNPVIGILGQGRYFNGSSQYIAITPGTSYQFANQTFSIAGWIKGGSDMSSAAGMLIAQGGCSGGWYVQVSSVINFTLKGSGTCGGVTLSRSSAVTVNDNKWHHFVIVATTSTTVAGNISASIYIDGVLNQGAQSVDGTTYTTSNAELDIGARDTGGGPYFAGNVDDLRIYNRGLTATEVVLLYKQGSSKQAVSMPKTTTGLGSGLVGYWTLDGKDTNWNTNTTVDKSGNGNTLTLTGMSTSTSPTIGRVGQALNFNGSTSYIVLPDNLIKNTVTLTVSLWFRTTTGGGLFGYQDAAALGSPTQWVPVLYVGSNGRLFGQFWNGSINVMNTTPTVNDGKWHHALITGNTNTQSLYFDGALVATLAGTINNLNMSKNQVGLANEGGAWPLQNVNGWDYFKGQIDDVRFYTRALSASEVVQLYKQGTFKNR